MKLDWFGLHNKLISKLKMCKSLPKLLVHFLSCLLFLARSASELFPDHRRPLAAVLEMNDLVNVINNII